MSLQRTGGVRVILEVASRLAERGHDVTVTSAMGPADDWFPKMPRRVIVSGRFSRLLWGGLGRVTRTSVWREVYQEALTRAIPECDINVATFSMTAQPTVASARGIPVYHIQHFEPIMLAGYESAVAEATYRLPLRKIVNSSWVRSQLVKRDLASGTEPLIHPAIDHKIFRPGGSATAPVITCLAKRAPIKGFAEALEAFRRVRRLIPSAKLRIFGDDLAPREPGVEFIGKPSDKELAATYSTSQVVLCPSWFESFPLPPLEAMACGTPVVTTRYGTEDFAHDQQNALVIEPRNPTDMAAALVRLLKNDELRKTLSQAGLQTAKRFTWDATVTQVEAAFHRILNAPVAVQG